MLADVAPSVGTSSHGNGRRFDSWSEHIPGLQVRSPVGARRRGNWSMFLSHNDVSLPLSLPPFPSL